MRFTLLELRLLSVIALNKDPSGFFTKTDRFISQSLMVLDQKQVRKKIMEWLEVGILTENEEGHIKITELGHKHRIQQLRFLFPDIAKIIL
jgi:hypothetical protein